MVEFVVLSVGMIVIGARCEKSRTNDKRFLRFFCFLFGMMAALRAREIGNDTHAYIDLFNSVRKNPLSLNMQIGRWEVGYLILNKILSFVSSNPQIILAFSGIVTYYTIYVFIKNESDHYWISIILVLINSYFRLSLSAIRQMLAISILILGLYQLKKKRYLLYFLLSFLAFSIHTSSIIPSVILFFSVLNWNRWVYRTVFIASIILVISGGLLDRLIRGFLNYSRYIGSIYDDGINVATVFLILMSLSCLAVIYFSDREGAKDNLFLKLEFVRFCILLAALRMNSLDRMADYFTLFEIVGVTNALSKYKSEKVRVLLVLALFFFYILYSYVWGIMRPNLQMIWPYRTFWM